MSGYLKHIRIDRFGAFANKQVGPFSPGLNVVFGRNEAGKTTLTQFVGGVLFGWEDARGNKNTYKPADAERAGALIFASDVSHETPAADETAEPKGKEATATAASFAGDPAAFADVASGGVESAPAIALPESGALAGASFGGAPDASEREVCRARNVDGLQGATEIAADIDKETFQTMFLLTSDELRTLRNAPDVTAHLLTAGSGTANSPAAALQQVEDRIQQLFSKAGSAENSIVRLQAQMKDLGDKISEGLDEAERFKEEDRAYRSLERQRQGLLAQAASINEEIDELVSLQAQLKKSYEHEADLQAQHAELKLQASQVPLQGNAQEASQSKEAASPLVDDRLLSLGALEERALRDVLDDFAEEQIAVQHAVQTASSAAAESQVAYESLVELAQAKQQEERSPQRRTATVALLLAIALVFVVAGVPVFVQGRTTGSLSFSLLGAGLVASAVLIAAGTLVAFARRPQEAPLFDQRLQDAQWAMLQDQKKLAAAQDAQASFESRLATWLFGSGLGAAGGSVRQARTLLDEARDTRAAQKLQRQRTAALDLRIAAAEAALSDCQLQKARLVHDVRQIKGAREMVAVDADEQGAGATLAQIERLVSKKTQERDELLSRIEQVNFEYGKLGAQLQQAKAMHALDKNKQDFQQLKTRLEDSKVQLAKLLIARKLLLQSIDKWESKSQPQVYDLASKLFALMTDGAWTRIALTPEGDLVAIDAAHTTRSPRMLSLGTCQQLYLALRIALLMNSDKVGAAIPVLADDILVHFDSQRRIGAAKALAQLAQTRQVILFTCHEEVVEAMRAASAGCQIVEL